MSLSTALNHPLRLELASEAHARPFMHLEAPVQISHIAVFAGRDANRHGEALAALCQRFGVAPPAPEAHHFSHDFGHFRLKWEYHTEFSTYTFAAPHAGGAPFDAPPIRHIPLDWLDRLSGSVLAAAHITVERGQPTAPTDPCLRSMFPVPPLVGSRVLLGGEVWTDFHVAPDGFSRFLIRDTGLRETQTGRLVQRICEIETYRMMALLALPLARDNAPGLTAMEEELAHLSARLVAGNRSIPDEQLLHELSGLAARVEALALQTGYRYSAAQAYYRLVKARIAELREDRIEGVPTIGEFMERRLSPAMDTCLSAAARQENLASKVARTNDLLRTRVNIAQERQNQEVLLSLSRSARLQVRLQQAVEGLSVVAISYYLVGLAGYALKAMKGWGVHVEVDSTLGFVLPLACGLTWLGLQRMHKRLEAAHEGDHR